VYFDAVCLQILACTDEKNVFKTCAVQYLIRDRLPINDARF